MNPVQYSVLEAQIARGVRWDPGALDAHEFEEIRDAVGLALDEAWTFAWWDELLVTRQMHYAPAWDSEASYRSGAVVWHAASRKYYQSLPETTSVEPADWDGTKWVRSSAWASWASDYSGTNWDPASAYSDGDVVWHEVTGNFYQCHTAAAAGEAPPDVQWWGKLSFRREAIPVSSVEGEIGHVRQVTATDPRLDQSPVRIPNRKLGDELVLYLEQASTDEPWVQFLPPIPRFDGDNWSETEVYGPDPGESQEEDDMPLQGYNGFAQLRAKPTHVDREMAYVFWGNAENDGAAGWFRYTANAPDADDNGDKIRPTNNPLPALGCWIRTT